MVDSPWGIPRADELNKLIKEVEIFVIREFDFMYDVEQKFSWVIIYHCFCYDNLYHGYLIIDESLFYFPRRYARSVVNHLTFSL